MSRLLRLYPRRWRSRYAQEVEALLEELPPSPTDAVDLALGALRAHFSSTRPGGPAPSASEGALMVFDLRHRFSRKDRLGAVAAVILFPGALFLCLSLLKYTFGMAAPFDSAAPVYLAARPVEYATFLTPFVAFAVALVPILGLKLERSAGTLRAHSSSRLVLSTSGSPLRADWSQQRSSDTSSSKTLPAGCT
jgi:hypothetical protein